jgi:formylmethanofuran dehydrogenase subunit D
MICITTNDICLMEDKSHSENKSEVEYRKIQGLVGDYSLSFVLPKKYANDLGLEKGDYVKVSTRDHQMIIEKA